MSDQERQEEHDLLDAPDSDEISGVGNIKLTVVVVLREFAALVCQARKGKGKRGS